MTKSRMTRLPTISHGRQLDRLESHGMNVVLFSKYKQVLHYNVIINTYIIMLITQIIEYLTHLFSMILVLNGTSLKTGLTHRAHTQWFNVSRIPEYQMYLSDYLNPIRLKFN